MRKRPRLNWVAVPVPVLVWLGLAAYDLHGGLPPVTSATPSARAHMVTQRHAGHVRKVPPVPKTATSGAVPARTLTPVSRTLTPVSAAAFGPSGIGQGDDPEAAPFANDGNLATAWHTDQYATARFGNLYAGTGLLLDMGLPATITAAWVTLGAVQGASFRLRVGAAPALADLPPVAQAASTGGVVHLRLSTPAHGRYVLIWFTSLPPDRQAPSRPACMTSA